MFWAYKLKHVISNELNNYHVSFLDIILFYRAVQRCGVNNSWKSESVMCSWCFERFDDHCLCKKSWTIIRTFSSLYTFSVSQQPVESLVKIYFEIRIFIFQVVFIMSWFTFIFIIRSFLWRRKEDVTWY